MLDKVLTAVKFGRILVRSNQIRISQSGDRNWEYPELDPVGNYGFLAALSQMAKSVAAFGCFDCFVTASQLPPQFPLRNGSPLDHCGSGAALQSPAVLSINEAALTPGPHAASTDEAICPDPRAVYYSAVNPGMVETYPFFTRSFQ